MATNAKALQDYFAGLDAEEERVGEKYGISPDEVRSFEMQDVGEEMTPPSLQKTSEYARPNSRAASGLERLGLRLNQPVDMPETVPSLAMPSGVPAKTSDFASRQKLMSPGALKAPEMRDIPIKTAPPTKDVAAPTASVLPTTTADKPAGKPDSAGTQSLPAPSSEGAGGDALGRLSLGQALTRALEGSGSIIAGRDLRSGAADTLGERMKQIEALRAKREEQSLEQQRERATWGTSNRATLASALAQWKGDEAKTAALEALASGADTTKPSDFSRNAVNAVMTKPKVLGAEATTKKTGAQGDVAAATAEAVPEKVKTAKDALASLDAYRRATVAQGWARIGLARQQAAKKVEAESPADAKAVGAELDKIQKITQKAGYTPLVSSLEQADQAISGLGAPPSTSAQIKHSVPGGDRFLTPQEKAYYTSVDKLRQMDQLAVSGKVVSEPERAEFLRQYGANWYANPKAAGAYIDLLRQKTARQLQLDLAPIRASSAGQKALSAFEQAGGVTENLPVFKGAGATSVRPAKPADIAGTKTFWRPDKNTWVHYSTDSEAKARAAGVRLEE